MPLDAVRVITLRLTGNRETPEFSQRLFFDCIRSVVLEEIRRAATMEKLAALSRVILPLFQLRFLRESLYYHRFTELLEEFQTRISSVHARYRSFSNLHSIIEKERETFDRKRREEGKPKGRLPARAEVFSLARPIQSKLARERPDLRIFAQHPELRLARQTLPLIDAETVGEVVTCGEVHAGLLQEVINKLSMVLNPQVCTLILQHPRCTDLSFAKRKLPDLRDGVLQRLCWNPETYQPIVTLARQELRKRGVRA